MMRPTLLLSALFTVLLAAAPARAQEDELASLRRRPESPTPAWLPRGVFVGTYIEQGVITPQLRLQWELTLIQERVDSFVAVLEGGGGYGAVLTHRAGIFRTTEMTFLYQYPLLAAVGYRGTRSDGIHLGAHAGVGAVFYGARFNGLPKENFIAGLVEGRAQAGYKLGPVVYGVALGYASPFGAPLRSAAGPFLGGFQVGLFADWR